MKNNEVPSSAGNVEQSVERRGQAQLGQCQTTLSMEGDINKTIDIIKEHVRGDKRQYTAADGEGDLIAEGVVD